MSVCLSSSSGFGYPATQIGGSVKLETSSPAIADLNEDGMRDAIFADLCPTSGLSEGCVDVIITGNDKAFWLDQMLGGGPDIMTSPPLCVHALDGAASPPYSTELPGFPRPIQNACANNHPTVAIGDVNFDGHLDVVVGGSMTNHSAFAIQRDGSNVPGWENSVLAAAPTFNAAAIADANADGAVDAVFVDESTYLQRFGSLGYRRQCQYVGDPVFASPAVSDVARPGQQLADGIPDEIGAAWPGQIQFYNSFGFDQNCNGTGDSLLSFIGCNRSSSPATGDMDGDGTADVVVQAACSGQNRIQVFASTQGLEEYVLPAGSATPTFGRAAYSSPAILSLDNDGVYRHIAVGTDSGRLVVLKYVPTQPAGSRLQLVWQTDVLDTGYSVSASPTAIDLDGDGKPEFVIGNDAGNVYVISNSGAVLGSASLLNGSPWSATASIWSTPAVWSRSDGDSAMIIAGNRRGVFKIVLDTFPAFAPANAQWHTFHRNNARTGALPYSTTPTRGSVGGVAHGACASAEVRLLDSSGTQLDDYYGGQAIVMPKSDGRYLFEMRTPGAYIVRFMISPTPQDVPVTVTAGARANADGC